MDRELAPDQPSTSLSARSRRTVALVLATVRKHLGMDIAFVSRFRAVDRVLEHVDSRGDDAPIHSGQVIALSDGYCLKVVNGELPELIPDTSRLPAAAAIPETSVIPIGSHLSVPIRLADGRLFGTFCCFGYEDKQSLNERDLRFIRAFADLVAGELDADDDLDRVQLAHTELITQAIAQGEPTMVFQPIHNLKRNEIEGFECLARFGHLEAALQKGAAAWTPDRWFRKAHEVGLGHELEIAAIRRGLSHLAAFSPRSYLSVNCSASTILSGRLPAVFAAYPGNRVVVELTEHESVADYPTLLRAIAPLRAAGIRIAIDDTGAGYASMRHVLQLEPDKIKLDLSLTRNVDTDAKKRALVAALVAFGRESGAQLIAEGVEQAAESKALAALGVDSLQGYLIGRPLELTDALQLDAEGPSGAGVASPKGALAAVPAAAFRSSTSVR